MNPYDILGIASDSSVSEIKSAYRRRSMTLHPDAGGSAKAFAELTEARDILLDPIRRERFDATGNTENPAEDSPQAMLLAILSGILDNALQSDQSLSLDLAKLLQEKIESLISDMKKHILELQRVTKRAEKLSAKFKHKKKSRSIAHVILTGRITLLTQELARAKIKITGLEGALALAQELTFEPDLSQPDTSRSDPFSEFREIIMKHYKSY